MGFESGALPRRQFLQALGVVGAAGTTTAAPERTGRVDDPPVKNWTIRLSDGVATDPIGRDGTFYVGDGSGGFHAIDAATGDEVWSVSLVGAATDDSVVLLDDSVVVGTEAGRLYRLSLDDGRDRWTASPGGAVAGVDVVDDGVYVGTSGGSLAAYALADGSERWSADGVNGAPTVPGVVSDTVVVLAEDAVLGLDPSSGDELWRTNFDNRYERPQPGAREVHGSDGYAYFPSDAGILKIDPVSGSLEWYRETIQQHVLTDVLVEDGYVFGGKEWNSSDRNLYGLNAGDGSVLWWNDLTPWSEPAVHDGTLYATGFVDETMYVRGYRPSTGTEQWSVELSAFDEDDDAQRLSAPATTGDHLAFVEHVESTTLNGYALDPSAIPTTATSRADAGDDDSQDATDPTTADGNGDDGANDAAGDGSSSGAEGDQPERGFFSNGENAKSLEESVSTTTLSLLIGLVGTIGTIAQLRGGDD